MNLAPTRAQHRWWPDNALFAADFTNGRYMSGGVAIPAEAAFTFARASQKRAQARDGNWILFAENVPAITDQGLLLEAASTNLLPNSAFSGGAAATYSAIGSANLPTGMTIRNLPAGCTAETAYGTEFGLPYMDIRVYGTATNNTPFVLAFSPNNAVPCLVGQKLQISLSARLLAGLIPLSTTFRVYEYDAGGANLSTVDLPALNLTANSDRFAQEYAATGATAAAVGSALRIGIGTGVTVDFTARICAPQVERQSGPPTSVILTTGASAARTADEAILSLPTGATTVRFTIGDATTLDIYASAGPWQMPVGNRVSLVCAFAD